MSMRRARLSDRVFEAQKERLRETTTWFPYAAFIPFGFVLLFTSHVVFGTNPRVGNPADLLTFKEQPSDPSSIWISVTPIGDELVVTTHDRKVFRWPINVRGVEQIEPFTAYLRGRAHEEIMTAAIAKQAFAQQTRLVIAADQSLRYRHVRPILYAMARAKITNYAFETRMPPIAEATAADPETETIVQ